MVGDFEEINKDFILARLTEEQIFEKYLEIDGLNTKKHYTNILREDKDKGCTFYVGESGRLYFRDWAWRDFDCFAVVMQKYLIGFQQSILKIAVDFNLLEGESKEINTETYKHLRDAKRKVISFDIKSWDKVGLAFWRKHISWLEPEHLEKYGIFMLYKLYIDNSIKYTNKNEAVFLYYMDKNRQQLYAPYKIFKNTTKFITTGTKTWGTPSFNINLGYAVITKSIKCSFLARMIGLNNMGILGETMLLDEEAVNKLEYIEEGYRFTLFDPDWAGMRAAIRYKNLYKTTPLFFPKDMKKDLSDNLEYYKEHFIMDYITDVANRFGIFSVNGILQKI